MAVPSSKLIVLSPVIITYHQIDTESRFKIRTNHGAALAIDCLACVHLKIAVKSLAGLVLNWLFCEVRGNLHVMGRGGGFSSLQIFEPPGLISRGIFVAARLSSIGPAGATCDAVNSYLRNHNAGTAIWKLPDNGVGQASRPVMALPLADRAPDKLNNRQRSTASQAL
jgi:hypothetical protein